MRHYKTWVFWVSDSSSLGICKPARPKIVQNALYGGSTCLHGWGVGVPLSPCPCSKHSVQHNTNICLGLGRGRRSTSLRRTERDSGMLSWARRMGLFGRCEGTWLLAWSRWTYPSRDEMTCSLSLVWCDGRGRLEAKIGMKLESCERELFDRARRCVLGLAWWLCVLAVG